MPPPAILDANVLFPMLLRDTLLRIAAAGCFRVLWSDCVLEEMTRNLIHQHRVDLHQAARLKAAMNQAFPEARVTGWEALVDDMRNDLKDRHVAAAAVKAGASVIVTMNLKDFYDLPDGLRAMDPDTFLAERFAAMPAPILEALVKQAAGYRNPPASLSELLDWLEADLPKLVANVRPHVDAGKS